MHGKDSSTVTVRLPDELVEQIKVEAMKDKEKYEGELSVGLWLKQQIYDLFGYKEKYKVYPEDFSEAILMK